MRLHTVLPGVLLALTACSAETATNAVDAARPPPDDAPADAKNPPPDAAADGLSTNDVAHADASVDAPAALTVAWSPCASFAGVEPGRASCADVMAPLDWSHPEGERIALHVRRLPAMSPSGRAVWILMGGPGQAGDDGETLAAVLSARDPGLDVFLPDHRGTGASTPLTCTRAESDTSPGGPAILPTEWPDCRDEMIATWGERLQHFSTTAAARDLSALIDATRAPDDRVVVFGVSYGTYLAHRYLQVAPTQSAGVIMDSVCAPGACTLSDEDRWEDGEARALLARCASEPDCASRLGPDAAARLEALYGMLAAGHCPMTNNPARNAWLLRSALGNMMMSSPQRRAIPAVIHRMLRCNDGDRMALATLYTAQFGPQWPAVASLFAQGAPGTPLVTLRPLPVFGGGAGARFSFPLAVNILTSELWEPSDPSPAELTRRWEATLSCRGVARQAGWQTPGWPRFRDPLASQFFASEVPVLVLNAEIDSATPARFARAFSLRLRAPLQRYIEVPNAAHSVVAQGVLAADTSTTCGREMELQFLRDPRAATDTACLGQAIPLAFAATPALSRNIFGDPSLWGD